MLPRIALAAVLGVSLGLTILVGLHVAAPAADDPATPLVLKELMDEVEREYVDPVDASDLIESAARGMVADLDRHSQFLNPSQYADLRISASGGFSGVGLEVVLHNSAVVVDAAYPDAPAARAGVSAGDILLRIDGEPVLPADLYDTVSRLRGEAGTTVSVVTQAAGGEERQYALAREPLAIPSVDHRLLAPGVGLIAIRRFHERTMAQTVDAIAALNRDNLTPLTGLVVDLRGNPGGILESAVEVADLFLSEGLIVSARGRSASAGFEHHASASQMLPDAAMVILIDGASASAAEVLAAALRDHGRARLVGTTSFGKGLVQTVVPLRDGAAIKMTTSRYYTPLGKFIDRRGLTPDVVVHASTDPGIDIQVQAAMNLLAPRRLTLSEKP